MDYEDPSNFFFPDLKDSLRTYKKSNLSLADMVSALEQIQLLCKQRCRVSLDCLEYQQCFFCRNEVQAFQEHRTARCGHKYHLECSSQQIQEKCRDLDFGNAFIVCQFCQQMLDRNEILKSVPASWINKREMEILQQQTQMFDDEVKTQRYFEAMNHEFTCNICSDTYKLNEKGKSLNCGCQFCEDCLRDYAISKINDGQFFEKQMFCPNVCKKQGAFIDPFLLESILTGENAVLYQRVLDFRSRDYERDKNLELLKCPGYILRRKGQKDSDPSFTTMSQEQIEAFRMQAKFQIPPGYTMHECKNIWEFDPRSNLKQTKCGVCSYEFCLFGCEKSHVGSCQDFKKWIEVNKTSDQEFQNLVKRERLVICPKCKSYIQKSEGCNHMTCRRPNCGKEFCYVCGKDHPCNQH